MSLLSEDDPKFRDLTTSDLLNGVWSLLKASLSTSLAGFCTVLYNTVILSFTGDSSDPALVGGLGVGFVAATCLAYQLTSGIAQGINVLCGHALGSKKSEKLNIFYFRGILLILCSLLVIVLFSLYAQKVLVFCGINSEVAGYAQQFLRTAIPSYIFSGIFEGTKNLLFSQNVFNPVLYLQLSTLIIHIFQCYLWIHKFNLGVIGAGIARNITDLINCAGVLWYIQYNQNTKENWVSPLKADWKNEILDFKEIKKFLDVVVPIAAILFLDIFSYELFTLLAGQFDEIELAAHVAISNSSALYYMLPLGVSITTMTFVSNYMGAKKINAVKNLMFFGSMAQFVMTLLCLIACLLFQNEWAQLYSSNSEVKIKCLSLLYIYLVLMFFDGFQVVLSGVLKGIGKQKTATLAVFLGYYVFCFPLIYLLAFRNDMKVYGIWLGFCIAIIFVLYYYIEVIRRTDFKAQAEYLEVHHVHESEMVEYEF